MITRFFDAETRPPRGGWSFPIGGDIVTRYTESSILDELRRYRRNNQTFVSEEALEEELWAYYCQQDPGRCKGQLPNPSTPGNASIVPAEKTPERQGPPIWTFLNTLAAQWIPTLHPYFLETCNAISVILECPKCQGEWRKLMQQYPPAGLSSRVQVCQWVNLVHNEVNARRGARSYPYSRMVIEYGAPTA